MRGSRYKKSDFKNEETFLALLCNFSIKCNCVLKLFHSLGSIIGSLKINLLLSPPLKMKI